MLFSGINSTVVVSEEGTIDLEDTSRKSIQSNSIIEEFLPVITAYEEFGNQEDFWTINFQSGQWLTIRATLLAVGQYCYIYMDNRTISSMGQNQAISRCETLKSEFDRVVYPKNVELMGHPNGTLGDIDGDPHITVFLVEDVGSYYLEHNEIAGTTYSNQREMVYVSSEMGLYNTIAVMCHETNHLFLFNYDLDDVIFTVEGLAEYSMYYAGYMSNSSFMDWGMTLNVTMSAYQYSIYPEASMFYFDENYYSYASYGISYMFWLYVSEKYTVDVIKDLVPLESLDGPEGLEYVLSLHGYNISFNDLFLDFITAMALDELGIYNDLYGFKNAEFSFFANANFYVPYTINEVNHRYYGVYASELSNVPNEFTIVVETPNYPRSLGIVVAILDENGWAVNQTILTGDGYDKFLHFEGLDISKVVVITSLIREGTPNAPRDWMASPVEKLDFSFLNGHVSAIPEETSFISLISIMFVLLVILKKKRKVVSSFS